MKVLVTGAEGFVGTHLVRELLWGLPDEDTIVALDKRHSDLSQPHRAESLIDEHEPDYVVHLAARYGRLLCRDEPHTAVADNTASTTEIASVCATRGISVLYASSSEVYGDHGTETITENSELRMPTTIYGLSKRWGEEVLRLYLPPENLCIVRMNMLYGPLQLGGYGRCALATFIENAVQGESVTVHRDTSRSWLYISDAVRALRMLIDHSGVWNLGNPYEREPLERTARRVTDDIVMKSAPPDQIRHKNFDSSKIRHVLGWKPEVGLEEGIERTMEWAREEYRAPVAA